MFYFNFLQTNGQTFSRINRVGFQNELWLTQRTPHFNIHHSAQQHDLGLYYSKIAETAYQNLSSVFDQSPEKITIIINDSTDSSNGYATVIPYPLIMIYPVQISNQESLSEAGEWARELLTHEMTHIFQMFPYRGFYNWLRPIYGTVVSPNLITPNWWKEGMAIEMETQFSPQGRTRSYLQSATIRALVIDDQLSKFSLAEANETLKTWPYGNRPYFLGSMLMSEITSEYGITAISSITDLQSGRFPYFVEAPVQETIGRSYQAEFDKMIETQTQQATKQIDILKKIPDSSGQTVDSDLLSSRNPRFQSLTQTLGLIGQKKSGSEIIFYNWNEQDKKYRLDSKQKKILGSVGSFEFHPLKTQIIFSKIKFINSKQQFSDLYIYDFSTQTETQITHNQRAREPQFSIDGTNVLFITTADGQTELKIMDLNTEKIESLYKTDFKDRLTQALDLNETEVLLNIRNQNGDQVISVLNKKTHQINFINTPYSQLRFVKKIDEQIYFTSTNNGVSNIYSIELAEFLKTNFKNLTPETHLLTGALSFDVDAAHSNLFVTVIGSAGSKVQVLKKISSKNIELPKIKNEIADRYKFKDTDLTNFETTVDEYSVWPEILPHYWFPYISTSSSNRGVYTQIQTAGQDPLNLHNYQFFLNYESYFKKIGFNLNYLNSVYDWQIATTANQTQKIYGLQPITLIQKNSYTLGLLPDVFKINENLSVNLGVEHSTVDDSFLTTDHSGGYLQTLYKNFEQKVTQYYPMSGYGFDLRYKNLKAQKDLGPYLGDYSQVTGSVMGYFSNWLPEDHSVLFKLDGIYTFENVSSRFGTSHSQFAITADDLAPQFTARGYRTGQFYGSQLVTATTEYRFPIKDIHRGTGTDPFFIKTLTGAVVIDGLATKGFGVNQTNVTAPLKLSDQFYSLGFEARFSTTLGYFIPMNFIFGYYLPLAVDYGQFSQMGLSLQAGGF